MEKYTVSVLAENHAGVLSRVVGMFSRRGFNIDSLSVGTTVDENISRITIEVIGDSQIVEQVSKQLSKIIEVIKVKTLKDSEMVKRGLLLCKVKTTAKTRGEIMEITNVFRAKVVDISQTTITVEMTGSEQKLEAFLEVIKPYGIEEISRTGMTALERGANVVISNNLFKFIFNLVRYGFKSEILLIKAHSFCYVFCKCIKN